MKKCYFCGIKTGLKNIWVEEDENDRFNDHKVVVKLVSLIMKWRMIQKLIEIIGMNLIIIGKEKN